MSDSKPKRIKFNKYERLSLIQITTLIAASATLGYYLAKRQLSSKRELVARSRVADAKQTPSPRFRIVCFGDSVTWGRDPDALGRLPNDQIWCRILEKLLNNSKSGPETVKNFNPTRSSSGGTNICTEYEVLGEGLSGRTIDQTDEKCVPFADLSMHGLDQILPALYSHKPVDLVIVMLGINDCKTRFDPSAKRISTAMEKMLDAIKTAEIFNIDRERKGERVILMPSVYIREITDDIAKKGSFGETSMQVSQQLPDAYRLLCQKEKYKGFVKFADGNQFGVKTGSDGIHLDGEGNLKLAQFLEPIVKEVLQG